MSNTNRSDRIRALIESIQRKLDELKKILDEDEGRQSTKLLENDPFYYSFGGYIQKKKSTHGHKMKGLSLFSSFVNEGREINTEDSGSESIKLFCDIPMETLVNIPLHRLLKYRLLGRKSISVLKEMVLEDGRKPHESW